MRTGDGWQGIEVADVVAGEGIKAIRAARFKVPGNDQVQYAVDTAGHLDFTNAPILTFERSGAVRATNLELTVRSTSGSQRRVPYQMLVSDDGYTYARIAAYRTGQFRVNGLDYAVSVRSLHRGAPFYAAYPGTVVMIDLNRDGTFAEQVTVAASGRAMAAEKVAFNTPFVLDGRAFELSGIDSGGTQLAISPSTRTTAVAAGFRAPPLSATLLDGGRFQLSKQSGKVVLIEFWATNCGYSEGVRAAANAFADSAGPGYTWLAVAREDDLGRIRQHLDSFPMHATIALRDNAAWETFNPNAATPRFIVIDRRGVVRLQAEGESAMPAVLASLKELLGQAAPR